MTCKHWELTCDGFSTYHYCIRCHVRVHIVMISQFGYSRFIECLEKARYPRQIFGGEKPCKCRETVKLNDGEQRLD